VEQARARGEMLKTANMRMAAYKLGLDERDRRTELKRRTSREEASKRVSFQ
jgi:hypothetical protein